MNKILNKLPFPPQSKPNSSYIHNGLFVYSTCIRLFVYSIDIVTIGIVTSPNYPGKYPNNLENSQTIKVEEGLAISLEFTAFNIEYSSTCRYDHLTITDGDGTTLMRKRCGTTVPDELTSRSNVVKLLFHTDRGGTRSGWSLSWRAVTPTGFNDRIVTMFANLLNLISFWNRFFCSHHCPMARMGPVVPMHSLLWTWIQIQGPCMQSPNFCRR